MKSVDSLDGGPKWHCKLMKVEGDLDSSGNRTYETGEFWYRNILEIHESLLANPDLAKDSSYAPFRMYTDDSRSSRLYSEAMSGDWAWDTQVCTHPFHLSVSNNLPILRPNYPAARH